MNFDFPDELKQLRDEARAFLRDRCGPAVPRAALDGGGTDLALWRQMAALGWVGAAIPEHHGGAGLGHLAVCVLAEELGRAYAPVPFASVVYLAAEALLLCGDAAQQAAHLPAIAAGSTIATLALAERPGPVNLARMQTRVIGASLTGTKVMVPDGDLADLAIVGARDEAGVPALYLVDLTGPGVQRATVACIDPTRPHATLVFDSAPAERLAHGAGADAIRSLLDHAAVMMAFEQLGNAQAALEMARDYALARYAFGRPIGSFQAIKHKLADVYVAVELARSNAYYGAWALHTDAAELPVAAAVARIAASDAGWQATKENIQTHGGMGFTWAFDCHMLYRRARLLGLALGGASEWKRRLVATLRARNTDALTAT